MGSTPARYLLANQNEQKQDGWLAGFESGGLAHDKAPTFGDGAPPQYDPSLIPIGVL
jgi:hypothetical protein